MNNRRTILRKCLRKERYDNQRLAEEGLAELLDSGEAMTPTRLTVYQCEICGGWHRGHVKKNAFVVNMEGERW